MKTFTSFVVACSLIFFISCKAQQYPLNQNILNIPNNSYIKDTNNELDQYIGTWLAQAQNKNIKLVINKQLAFPFTFQEKSFKMDMLMVKYEIVINNMIIQQSTLNNTFTKTHELFSIFSNGTENNGNEVTLIFTGTNCGVGAGPIYFHKLNTTQFNWTYTPYHTTVTEECPPNADLNIYLPETDNLIFTKQ